MRFNPKANIGGGRVSGGGGGGGGLGGGFGGGGLGGGSPMRLPIPTSKGGCLMYAIVIAVLLVVTMCGGPNLLDDVTGVNVPGGQQQTPQLSDKDDDGTYDKCQTGEDANNSTDCARVAIVFSLEQFWEKQFEGGAFKAAPVITFSGSISTGCGSASSAMGPFYCPTDQTIYEDPTFYEEVFEGSLGGQNADFVEAYVLGHEYGHHIQNLTGEMRKVRTQQGENSDAVKLELEADCYAGVWTKGATGTADDEGVKIFESIDEQDIQEAISAARTVGDDAIQEKTQGSVNPDAWTHGSSAKRMEWFNTGFASGDANTCQKIWG